MVCALALMAGGCATMARGTDEVVGFLSEPPGAVVTLSAGQSCTTPCKLRLPRKDPSVALFTLRGHESVQVFVKAVAGASIYGNVILGGMIGTTVDGQTGAHNDLCPNPVAVRMRRLDVRGEPIGPAPARADDACQPKVAPVELGPVVSNQ